MAAPCGFLRILDRPDLPTPVTLDHHTGSRSLIGSFTLFSRRAGVGEAKRKRNEWVRSAIDLGTAVIARAIESVVTAISAGIAEVQVHED
jgi:hypothetical protein